MKEDKAKQPAAAAAAAAADGGDGGDAAAAAGGAAANGQVAPLVDAEMSGGDDRGTPELPVTHMDDPRLKMQRPPPTVSAATALKFKVVDLGNSCWRDRHFTSDIQTRQYRLSLIHI